MKDIALVIVGACALALILCAIFIGWANRHY